jgi:hypothetical protein
MRLQIDGSSALYGKLKASVRCPPTSQATSEFLSDRSRDYNGFYIATAFFYP